MDIICYFTAENVINRFSELIFIMKLKQFSVNLHERLFQILTYNDDTASCVNVWNIGNTTPQFNMLPVKQDAPFLLKGTKNND